MDKGQVDQILSTCEGLADDIRSNLDDASSTTNTAKSYADDAAGCAESARESAEQAESSVDEALEWARSLESELEELRGAVFPDEEVSLDVQIQRYKDKVLKFKSTGMGNDEIAERLGITSVIVNVILERAQEAA